MDQPEPEYIEFVEEECCALLHAFTKNPQAIAPLITVFDARHVRLLADELVHTVRLRCVLNADDRSIYNTLSKAELVRLKRAEPKFRCVHSLADHKEALASIALKTTP